MKEGGALAKWLAKAKPGQCPGCGRERAAGASRVLCAEAVERGCRAAYVRLFDRDRTGPTLLRGVQRVATSPDNSARVRVHLACRHWEDLPPSLAARVGERRRCRKCAAKEDR